MPVLALGTAGYDNQTAAAAVSMALGAGLTNIHAAFDYYNLAGVGEGLRNHSREDFFLTAMTSPCIHPAAPPIRNVSAPSVCTALTTRDIDELLHQLGVKHVDLLLLHGPNAAFNTTTPCSDFVCGVNNAQWQAYEQALADGKTRAIGVSNFCQSCFKCLKGRTPAVNQIQLHVGMGHNPEGLLAYHEQRGIITQAYSPLAAGGVVHDPLVQQVAANSNKSAAQVGLRWVLQNPYEATLVVKVDKADYLQEDLDVFGWNIMPNDDDQLTKATLPKGQQDGRLSWGCCDA